VAGSYVFLYQGEGGWRQVRVCSDEVVGCVVGGRGIVCVFFLQVVLGEVRGDEMGVGACEC
jgi:hypothetical protein